MLKGIIQQILATGVTPDQAGLRASTMFYRFLTRFYKGQLSDQSRLVQSILAGCCNERDDVDSLLLKFKISLTKFGQSGFWLAASHEAA